MKYFKNWLLVRIILGVIVVLVEIGSSIEGDWGTAIAGMLLALFLTVSPVSIRKNLKLSYGLVFTFVLIAFFVASNQTMKSFNSKNPLKLVDVQK